MKCSACKNKNADSYKRIVPGHELFETLQKMSPTRPYAANSYFCEECLLLAAENLKRNDDLLMSNQNAVTVNITSSQTSNERSRNSTVLPNERSSNKENNPQPKRTKLADYRPGPASSKTRKAATNMASSQGSSDTTDKVSSQESEGDILLHIAGSTQSSDVSVSTTSRASTSRSASPKKAQPNVGSKISGREMSNQDSNSSSDDQQPPIAGPSAPIAKNPRIRQDTSRMPDAIRNFFQQGGQGPALNVNNYSRSLAG